MKKDRHSEFRKLIKDGLQKERYTGRQLSLEIGVHPSYINLVLSGKRNPPYHEIITKIANVLKIDREQLLISAGLLSEKLQNALQVAHMTDFAKKKGFSSLWEYLEHMNNAKFIVKEKDEKTGKWKEITPKK